MRVVNIFIISFYLLFPNHLKSQGISLELMSGIPLNVALPMVVSQQGEQDIRIKKAHFASDPFLSPIFWDWQIQYNKDSLNGFSIESIHHKLFLKNKPPEIERFGISHGYNYIFINRFFSRGNPDLKLNFGLGTVLAHPESTVRGKQFYQHNGLINWGYYFNGWAVNGGMSYQKKLFGRFFAIVHGKCCFSHSKVPIMDGSARLWNLSFMLTFGLKYEMWKH